MEEESQSVNTLVNKVRSSNLELYRIIVMLLIVAHHYVANSGLSELIQNNPLTLKSLFLLIFGMWGKTGINCFVLITGYFMCTSKISIKKISKLLLEVEFYKLVFYFIFMVMGLNSFSLISFSKALIPITSINNNSFTSCFLVFYLFIPFLNILVQNMNQKQHGYLLLLCVFAYVVVGSIPGFGITFNYVSWFCILFIIASYIRFYPCDLFEKTSLWGILTLASILVSISSVVVMSFLEVKFGLSGLHYYFVTDSNKVLAVLTALTSFMFFKNLKIKNSKLINAIAASTFGVLLIHANSDIMRKWLWKDTLKNVLVFETGCIYIHAFLSVIVVFMVCTIIDQLRISFIEKTLFNKLNRFSWFN